MLQGEIVFPETKPETEWVRGRALQKVSPTYRHGTMQMRVLFAMSAWVHAANCGRVAPEWRFRVTPPGEITRPLVPDVAYVSYAELPEDATDDIVDVPCMAPTFAVEILSPDDRADDVSDKIGTYLASGTSVVLVIDPNAKIAAAHDLRGMRAYASTETFSHDALPGFALVFAELFAK